MTEHLAILRKDWKLLDKILTGEKTVESRWYTTKRKPWGSIKAGETVYLKNSGEPVTAKATVEKVMQFELDEEKVKELLDVYGARIGIAENIPYFYEQLKGKKYCILVFLKDAQKVEPFKVDKTGHGMMAAWICAEKLYKKNYTSTNANQALDFRFSRS